MKPRAGRAAGRRPAHVKQTPARRAARPRRAPLERLGQGEEAHHRQVARRPVAALWRPLGHGSRRGRLRNPPPPRAIICGPSKTHSRAISLLPGFQSVQTSQAPENKGKVRISQRSQTEFVTDRKMPKTPANPGFVTLGRFRRGRIGGERVQTPSTPPYAVLGPAPAGERCSPVRRRLAAPVKDQARRPGRDLARGLRGQICGGRGRSASSAAAAGKPPPIAAGAGRGRGTARLQFVLEEPTGVTWIYAAGVDFTDPMIKHAEIGIGADRSAVDAFLRWRAAQGKPKP